MVHPIYDAETLKRATEAHFQKNWGEILKINLSMLEKHPDDEFLIWHIADNYLKLGNTEKALEFAEKIKESAAHKDDIMLRAAQVAQPNSDEELESE
ncbi:MAG: hypothetical protein U9Q92_05660 [archaeon]|nr:hypothetical protein [archaeon]